MVPAIFFRWRNNDGNPLEGKGCEWWPVWGPKHNDVEHFNFEKLHYHVDPRFLTKRLWRHFGVFRDPIADVQATPLNNSFLDNGPPKPVLRRMRCRLAHSEWQFTDPISVVGLNDQWKGKQCPKGKRGFVCPHKLFPLGSVVPQDGVITCPLHGLRIHAATGVCLGPKPPSPVEP